MAVELTFQIDFGTGLQTVQPPMNWKGLIVEIMFSAQSRKPFLSLGILDWVESNATKLTIRKNNAKTIGPSLYVGVPIRVTVCDITTWVFNGYINLADGQTKFECDMVHTAVTETGKIDWFNDNAASFNFAYLASIGVIQPAFDYKLTPYVIIALPNYTQAALLLFAAFSMAQQISDVTTTIASLIDELSGAVATYPPDVGQIIGYIIIIVLYVAYLFLLIALMVKLVQDFIDNIVQRKKWKLCMREADLFKRGCQYLGLTFQSNIYGVNEAIGYGGIFKDATYMPHKTLMLDNANDWRAFFKRPVDESYNFPFNPNVYGYYDDGGGTFKEFVEDMMVKYNAEFVIKNNVFIFREKHGFNDAAPFIMPNTGEEGFVNNLPDPHGTNASECPSQYYLAFQTEIGDLTTLHRYTGTTVEASVLPNAIPNIRSLAHGTSVLIQLKQTLAKRKESLTDVEKILDDVINLVFGFLNGILQILNALLAVVNAIINLFGGNPPQINSIPLLPTNIFAGRYGWMEISNDTFGLPKSFIGIQVGNDWELHPSTESWMSAISLFNNFHKKNLATGGNQALTFENHRFKFCCKDLVQVMNANILKDPLGRNGKFLKLRWDVHNSQAINVDYLIYTNFDNNLTTKIVVDGVQ